MHEDGLPPREATRKSMDQITGALVGIALVLSAVFVPMAFFAGSTGAIYRQFSITIVSAMVLSVIVAIVLTPALCATMLKPSKGDPHAKGGFFGLFNRGFDKTNRFYQGSVSHVVNRKWRYLFVYGILVGCMAFLFMRLPGSFLPEEDQGIMFSMVQLPAGASQERTLGVLRKLEKHFMEDEKENVNGIFTVAGFSFAGSGQNAGIAFISMKDWSERKRPDQAISAIIGRAYGAFSKSAKPWSLPLPRRPLLNWARQTALICSLSIVVAMVMTRLWAHVTRCLAWPDRTRALLGFPQTA